MQITIKEILHKRRKQILEKAENISDKPIYMIIHHQYELDLIKEFEGYGISFKGIASLNQEMIEDNNGVDEIANLEEVLIKVGKEAHFLVATRNNVGVILEKLKHYNIPKRNWYIGPTRQSYIDLYEKRGLIYENEDKIQRVYDLLADQTSKEVYLSILTRLCSPYIFHYEYIKEDFRQYFPTKLFDFTAEEVFIDAGMRDGNTSKEFIEVVGGRYKHIYGFEADPNNLEEIGCNMRGINNLTVYPYALYSKKTTLKFLSSNQARTPGSAHLSDQGDIEVESTDGDSLGLKPTFIKMDIEGAEMNALKGLEQTIRAYEPKLAICLYHNLTDWWEIPLYIHELVPDYKLYIRNHENMYCLIESVCYACKA